MNNSPAGEPTTKSEITSTALVVGDRSKESFGAFAGRRDAPRILFLGEAWGEEESKIKSPFVGWAGKELFLMLGEALPGLEPELHAAARAMQRYDLAWRRPRDEWCDASGIALTNVFNTRPEDNKIENLCGTKAEASGGYGLGPLARTKYLLPQHFHHLNRLEAELLATRPNLVVCLGNTALWALTGSGNIGTVRGTVREGELGAWKGKILPTYHPAGVLRQWEWRVICIADLAKAWRESRSPELTRPCRQILVSPTLAEIRSTLNAWRGRISLDRGLRLSADVETAQGQVTCIGFALTRAEALVIPLWDKKKPGWHYWPSFAEEREVFDLIEGFLQLDCDKVFQNGMYDLQYILPMGIRPTRLGLDTMLRHHALFPELQKGLGFLGSIYTSEPAWKLMRRKRPDTEKRDE